MFRLTWLHDDARIRVQIQLAERDVLAQADSRVLKVKVCEEARINMLAKELSQLAYKLLLCDLTTKRSRVTSSVSMIACKQVSVLSPLAYLEMDLFRVEVDDDNGANTLQFFLG